MKDKTSDEVVSSVDLTTLSKAWKKIQRDPDHGLLPYVEALYKFRERVECAEELLACCPYLMEKMDVYTVRPRPDTREDMLLYVDRMNAFSTYFEWMIHRPLEEWTKHTSLLEWMERKSVELPEVADLCREYAWNACTEGLYDYRRNEDDPLRINPYGSNTACLLSLTAAQLALTEGEEERVRVLLLDVERFKVGIQDPKQLVEIEQKLGHLKGQLDRSE
jgi:hypothetical protein